MPGILGDCEKAADAEQERKYSGLAEDGWPVVRNLPYSTALRRPSPEFAWALNGARQRNSVVVFRILSSSRSCGDKRGAQSWEVIGSSLDCRTGVINKSTNNQTGYYLAECN